MQNYKNADQYDDLESEVMVVDTETNTVKTKEDMSPFDIIKATADVMGVTLKEPRSNCTHCYGRGYVGFKTGTKEPVPCQCLYDETQKRNDIPMKMNRDQRRKMYKHFKANAKKSAKDNARKAKNEQKETE